MVLTKQSIPHDIYIIGHGSMLFKFLMIVDVAKYHIWANTECKALMYVGKTYMIPWTVPRM